MYDDYSAKHALKYGKGDCTELMIALCRINNIPARYIIGLVIKYPNKLGYHNWVEIFLPNKGWVPFDPTFTDGKNCSTTFNKMKNIYVYSSFTRDIKHVSWNYTRIFI